MLTLEKTVYAIEHMTILIASVSLAERESVQLKMDMEVFGSLLDPTYMVSVDHATARFFPSLEQALEYFNEQAAFKD